jgi:hypothetical protein
MGKDLGAISGSREPSPNGLGPSGFDPGRSPTLQMLELSLNESLIDDVTQVIQRTPFICRYPKRLWTIGLVSEFADALDRLNVKLAELQGADR